MDKVIISEERFHQLVSESINEVLMESLEDEGRLGNLTRNVYNGAKQGVQKAGQWMKDNGGIAGLTGNAYQWGRNQVANAKKNFEAGRLYQRAKNVDFDPMSNYRQKYGNDFANKMLAQRGSKYGQNRLEKMTRVWGGTDSQGVTPPQAGTEVLQGQGNQMAPQMSQIRPQQNAQTRQNVVSKSQAMLKQTSDYLTKKGFILLKDGQWVHPNDMSRAVDSMFPDCAQAARKYYAALKGARGLYESKVNELASKINEIGDTLKGTKKVGMLAGKRNAEALNNAVTTDDEFKFSIPDYNKISRSSDAYNSHIKTLDSLPPEKREKFSKAYGKGYEKGFNKFSNTVKGTLKEFQNDNYALEPVRKTTPEEFNTAKAKGEIEVHGEYNGYYIITWNGEWYYLNSITGMLCKPNK